MKNLEKYFAVYLAMLCIIFALTLYGSNQQITVDPPAIPLIKLVAIALLAIYEVLARLIPSMTHLSIIAFIIKILKAISDTLTVKRN